jgi:hypothetical protein
VSPDTTARYELAVEPNSDANASQAAAAAVSDSGPGPAYIRAELTSGGSPAKSTPITASPP